MQHDLHGTAYSGRPRQIFVFCGDPDDDEVTLAVGAAPEHGTSSAGNGFITYTPAAGYLGPDAVPFTASDGHGGTFTGEIPIDVRAPEAPTCTQGPIAETVRPGGTVSLTLFCFSPQGDPQTLSTPVAPAKGTLGSYDEFSGVEYVADDDATGDDTFTLRVSNAVGASEDQDVTITIDPDFNRAPPASATPASPGASRAASRRRSTSRRRASTPTATRCSSPA